MRIWKMHANIDDYKVLIPSKEEDTDKLHLYVGKLLQETWEPFQIEFGRSKRPISDSPMLYIGIMVLNEKSITVLEKYFTNTVELLELEFKNKKEKYWIMNIINVVDCLDYEKSKFSRYDDGSIMYCDEFAFIKEKVAEHHIFKVLEFPKTHMFVSDEFKQTVEEAGLTGFLFEEAWDSEK